MDEALIQCPRCKRYKTKEHFRKRKQGKYGVKYPCKECIQETKVRFIYKTTNIINGKIYIGKATNRESTYLGSGVDITQAIKKYGKENFTREILEYCTSDKELNKKEKYWITFFNSTNENVGYNLQEGGIVGHKRTEKV